jgi:hypothetical protein
LIKFGRLFSNSSAAFFSASKSRSNRYLFPFIETNRRDFPIPGIQYSLRRGFTWFTIVNDTPFSLRSKRACNSILPSNGW